MTLDERISLYLAKCPPAVSGSDGHGTTFKVACALVNGFALDSDAALRWMLVYNAMCAPAWKPWELRHKVAQAAKVAHEKPRGHLLGVDRNPDRSVLSGLLKPVPVPLTPRKSRFRTVGTVFSEPCVMRARAHTCVEGTEKQTSQASRAEYSGFKPENLPDTSTLSVESRSSVEMRVEWPALATVPGCKVGRPPEIEMANADWHALETSGLVHEPMVQLAAWMFGPDCTVIETEEATR